MGGLIKRVWEWAKESLRYVPGTFFVIVTVLSMLSSIQWNGIKASFDIILYYPVLLVLCIVFSISLWVLQQDHWSSAMRNRVNFIILLLGYIINVLVFGFTMRIIGIFSGPPNTIYFLAFYLLNFVVIDYWVIRAIQHIVLRRNTESEAYSFNRQWKDVKHSWSERNMW